MDVGLSPVMKICGQRPASGAMRPFSDVSGSSEHGERLEAEEYSELLDRFRRFARDIVPRHGGSIARFQGDGVLALFGCLESCEDDGRRATEAAIDLHAAVARLHAGSGSGATKLQSFSLQKPEHGRTSAAVPTAESRPATWLTPLRKKPPFERLDRCVT